VSTATNQERVDFARARWHSLCDTFCPTEDEVRDWLAKYRMNFVLHGINMALLEHNKLKHRNGTGLQEDEAIARAEEIMAQEQAEFEVRRAQQN